MLLMLSFQSCWHHSYHDSLWHNQHYCRCWILLEGSSFLRKHSSHRCSPRRLFSPCEEQNCRLIAFVQVHIESTYLVLSFVPPLQVAEHEVHNPHSPTWQSTETKTSKLDSVFLVKLYRGARRAHCSL